MSIASTGSMKDRPSVLARLFARQELAFFALPLLVIVFFSFTARISSPCAI